MIGMFLFTFILIIIENSKNRNNNDKKLNWVKEIGIEIQITELQKTVLLDTTRIL